MKLSRKFLFVVLAIVGVLFTLHINNALALPDGDCAPPYNCPPGMTGQFTMDDMGWWQDGDVPFWVWEPIFYNSVNVQLRGANPNWSFEWLPYVDENGSNWIPIFWTNGCQDVNGSSVTCDDPNATLINIFMACEPCEPGTSGIQFMELAPSTGPPVCESGCFEFVGTPNGDWDNIDGPNWQPAVNPDGTFWGDHICLNECPNNDPVPLAIEPQGGPETCHDWMTDCEGMYHWTQMGAFDENNVWTWDTAFVDFIQDWSSANPTNSPGMFPASYWTPVQTIGGVIENSKRFDRRYHTFGNRSMVILNLETGDSIAYPRIWKATGNSGNDPYVVVDAAPGVYPDGRSQINECPDMQNNPFVGCDGTNPNMEADGHDNNDVSMDNPNVCCRPMPDTMAWAEIEKSNTSPLDYSRISSVFWNQKQIAAVEATVDGGCYEMLDYQNKPRMWGLNGWAECYGPDYRWVFPGVLADMGSQDIVVTYDAGKTHTVNFNITDVREMPAIAAQHTTGTIKTTKSGKSIDTTKTIYNITVREVVDPLNPANGAALVVQWPEPDSALFGGMELRLYIGTNDPGNDDFLFVDAPAQIGTIVVPADVWQSFKTRMIEERQLSEVEIAFQYRVKGDNFQNRGHGDTVTFPIQ